LLIDKPDGWLITTMHTYNVFTNVPEMSNSCSAFFKPEECESCCFYDRCFLIRPMSRFGRKSDDLQREVYI
jgi:hypothetical protein